MRAVQPKEPEVRHLALREPPKQSAVTVFGIKSSLLIPGRGEPINDGAVVVEGDKIAWVGHVSSVPAKYKSVSFTKVPVLMPGLWDCHIHIHGRGPNGKKDDGEFARSGALNGVRAAKELERTLLAGFTSVREVSGFGGEVAPAIEEGTIIGPHVYSSFASLSMTAGHADIHNLPMSTVMDAATHGLANYVCDGVPECIRGVRTQIRRGAKLIKICATGGVGSLVDDPEDAEFSPEELKAMVDEAARAKRIIAAHCHGKEGIMNALHAGVKTIEHGSYLDEECVELMKEKDAILVATRLVIQSGLDNKDEWPPLQYSKMVKIAAPHKKAYALAVKSGVKIALGTDYTPGKNGKELFFAVEAGMTPLEAIEACTATCPETLGAHLAPKSGQLKEGYDADLIAVSANPLEDILIMAEVENITHVWKSGKLYKSL
jgi:imidazolonepropionase-like amidohydrolase